MFSIVFRLSRKVPGFGKLLKFLYKCDIPRTTKIGKGTSFGHNGLGIVIHPRTIIEDNVFIQHHVAIGVRWKGDGCPIIKSGASIGAYAIILGPVTIGKNATIGAGTLVTHDVPQNVDLHESKRECNKEKD